MRIYSYYNSNLPTAKALANENYKLIHQRFSELTRDQIMGYALQMVWLKEHEHESKKFKHEQEDKERELQKKVAELESQVDVLQKKLKYKGVKPAVLFIDRKAIECIADQKDDNRCEEAGYCCWDCNHGLRVLEHQAVMAFDYTLNKQEEELTYIDADTMKEVAVSNLLEVRTDGRVIFKKK